MGLIAWIRSFLRHTFGGGDNEIAMASRGEEVIHEEQWSKLPPAEREKWEPMDESTILWRRKPW